MQNKDQYDLAKRKLLYIQMANKELVKKSAGFVYSQELIDACDNYLQHISKTVKIVKQQYCQIEHKKEIA